MDKQIIRRRLLSWYTAHRRRLPWRETSDPYAIWVSEVMLQQTRVDTAIAYYLRFMKRFPTVNLLAQADLQEVLKLWEGLGYYSRARNLHRAAGIVVDRFKGAVPDDPSDFRSLPGVGDYIAAAVLSISFNQALPVVDGNVKRVLSRLLEIDFPVNRSGSHKAFQEPAGELISPETAGRLQPGDHGTGGSGLPAEKPRLRRLPAGRGLPRISKRPHGQLSKTRSLSNGSPSSSGHRRDPEKGKNAGGTASVGRIFGRTMGISSHPCRRQANGGRGF
ncbi:hypothetical protein DSCW_56770 [Desulfosarcina widdelii]|uniref:Adenine DNA glycosylase n=1 Tax=Desulfosarcina widdelii TaxID=947919 RepID=A0A5K7ZBS4_9BACT|nr:hypothetical protein [Desulfosarcina widdelii]BBO78260.1 hypothetical protein DSCW_56770 [Desulfosarcina widdelii]